MPRTERFGIGLRIDNLFLDLLELLRRATYAPVTTKPQILEEALSKTDGLRFFVQIASENKLIPENHFLSLGEKIEEIGRNIGGWRKGLLAKTPTAWAGEKK